jgi:hypothetical protein
LPLFFASSFWASATYAAVEFGSFLMPARLKRSVR